MRVLRVADVPSARAGGVARFMHKSGAALARQGVQVDTLFTEDLAPTLVPGGLRRVIVPWLVALKVVAIANGRRRPDVVEIHEPLAAPYAILQRPAPRRLAPCVVMSHGLEERGWLAQRERWRRTGRRQPLKSRVSVPLTLVGPARVALRQASRVMVLSTEDAEFLTQRRGIPEVRVARVNNGVDPAHLRVERAGCAAPRVLFVGSWIDRKGTPELCEAWRRLSLAYPELRLTVAGTLDAERVLQDFAPECRAGVTLVAEVDDAQLLSLLESHDIFVLPSWFEGMPLSVLEAAAAGLACVVTATCGNLDVFRPADPVADGALLIEPHSVEALVDAVSALADDRDLRARMGANARRRAATFTWDHTAHQLRAAYLSASRPGFRTAGGPAELDISVVVPTWQRPDELLRCLAALDAQTHPAAEVVVVVRDGDDATRDALAAVKLTRTTLRSVGVNAPGVVAAVNRGLEASRGAVVATTDDDAAAQPDWLARIHEHLRHGPDVGAIGGRDRLHGPAAPDDDSVRRTVGRLLPYGRLVGEHHRGDGPPRDVDVLKGVNIAVRRSALGEIRLDERLRGSGAQAHWELGLCLAIRRAGWRVVYDPAVAVDHYPAARLGGDPRDGLTPEALADDVHNETYALLRWLPGRRKVVAFAYGLLVGSRRAPGLLVALVGVVRHGRGPVLGRLMTAQRARLEALRSALDARRAPADPTLPAVTIVAHEVGTQGGMERQLGELCRGLLERGHRVVVVARRCELPAHPLLRRIRVPVPARPFALAYPAFFVAGSLAVRRYREGLLHTTGAVVCNNADLSTVHFCHHGFRDAGGGSRASRDDPGHRANAAASAWMSRLAERVCLRPARTRQLVAVSRGVKRELERLVPERRSDVIVIPNGVDPVRFAPDRHARADVRTRLGLGDDDLVALFVGGDWERKGLRWAIDGVAASDGWHLLVVGDGDELRYRAFARGRGLGDRLHFAGSRPDTVRYYASADAFLLPTSYEAFPLVVLEAAAAGLPLLAGRVSGVEELIDEGANGWFVDRDGASIGARLDALGADRALRRAMGAAAREAATAYTWDRVVDAYVKLYETLARAPGAATLSSA